MQLEIWSGEPPSDRSEVLPANAENVFCFLVLTSLNYRARFAASCLEATGFSNQNRRGYLVYPRLLRFPPDIRYALVDRCLWFQRRTQSQGLGIGSRYSTFSFAYRHP